MAKSNYYIGVVTVRLKAPKDYRPSVSTFKVGFISDENNEAFRSKTMKETTERLKKELSESNNGVELTAKHLLKLLE